MLEFLRFELRYRFRQPAVYLFAALFALMTFGAATTDAIQIGGGAGLTAIDSPFVVTQMLAVMSVLAVLLVTAFIAGTVVRDYDQGSFPLIFTKPIRRRDLLIGRFIGGTVASTFVMLGASLGLIIGRLMPWLDPERLGGLRLDAHLHALAVFVVPNLMVMGAIFFAVATLTRRMLYAYVGVVAFFVIYAVSQSFIADLDNDTVAALADPFGMSALSLSTRYWTPAERNTLLVPFEGALALNRGLWLAVGAAFVGLTLARFRLTTPIERRKRREIDSPSERSRVETPLPVTHAAFGFSRSLALCLNQARVELRGIVRSTPFLVIALLGVTNVFGSALGTIDQLYGTPLYPVTQLMLRVLDGAMGLFLLIVLTFYAGELVWRDRKAGLSEVFDAMPIPNWVPLISKLLALWGSVVVLSFVGMLSTMAVQVIGGYTHFELGLYATSVFGLQLSNWLFLCVLALFFQVFTNHRFAGYGLIVVYFVLNAALPAMGAEHHLLRFASLPGEPYSDMNGYGHFVHAGMWYRLYWGLACFVLVLIANLFWIRGTDHRFRVRLRRARGRVTRLNTALLALGTLGFFATGGWIFYNTNVVNDWASSDTQEDQQQRYEEEYGQYRDLAQPRIVATDVRVDLYPEERRVEVQGFHRLKNKTDEVIETLHVRLNSELKVNALSLPEGAREHHDEELGYSIYRLPQPLQPGQELKVEFDLSFEEPGFKDRGSSVTIVENGTFVHNSELVPAFGYTPGFEISDPNERRKRGLPERPRMPDLDDASARDNTYISTEADWVDFAITVSTSADQTALAPGYLTKQWEEDGRNVFRYEMDAPILNLWAILSARYEVARGDWKGMPIEVYYHPGHDYNVERMIDAVKKSLDYFTENFSPYQHRQMRIVEFPRYRSFAQSLPNIVPYSESIGFIADLRDPENIDYVFYVTAHELAHQWWAHQVIGANAQGGTVMSETLAQYSALMVMEREYGREHMRKFLEHELNRYLQGRALETHRELPLMRVENQPYIHYNKGSLVMYALREYIGEEAVNRALASYIEDVGFQEPPYTTSRQLVEHLRAVTPEQYAYLIEDLFETITLYDNRAISVTSKPLEHDQWQVDMVVETRKFRADEKGAEQEVEMNDWIEVGVLTKTDDGKEVPILRQKRQLTAGRHEITLVVDQQPSSAGIDPVVLLVDRNPDDNTRKVQ